MQSLLYRAYSRNILTKIASLSVTSKRVRQYAWWVSGFGYDMKYILQNAIAQIGAAHYPTHLWIIITVQEMYESELWRWVGQ